MDNRIVILGTGSVGSALGGLFRHHGLPVVWAARDPRAASSRLGAGARIVPLAEASRHGELLVVAVPWTESLALLRALPDLDDKIVVDATNPLRADWSPLLLGQENSAGEETQRAVPQCRVVKAFNTIFADMMQPTRIAAAESPLAAFLCGEDLAAKNVVAGCMQRVGLRPVDVGPLRCARYLEAMAHLNIQIAVGQRGGTQAWFGYHASGSGPKPGN